MKSATQLATMTALLGTLAGLSDAAIGASPNQTAQGIWADITGNGTFTFTTTNVYQYQPAVAAGYFTNALTSGPTVSCAGSPTNCATTNQPATPAAPAPDANQLTGPSGAVNKRATQCDGFFAGGSLPTSTYTQSVTVNGLNGRGNWTFTWTYTIAPTQPAVDPLTAWTLFGSNGPGGVTLTFNAQIAGESVLVSKQYPSPGKFSFSLWDPTIGNRVQNLALTVSDGVNSQTAYPTSTVVKNAPGAMPGAPGAVDFNYTTNAGSNGSTALLKNGDARTILNTDVFAGNNNGGADGSALAYAQMSPVQFTLGAGSYTLTLTGVVKGNSANATQSFGVQENLIIIGQGCGS
jgi:hypothetical protein